MKTRVWEVTNGAETYAGFGDDPIALARALLEQADDPESETRAASIDIHVGFYEGYEAVMTVTR